MLQVLVLVVLLALVTSKLSGQKTWTGWRRIFVHDMSCIAFFKEGMSIMSQRSPCEGDRLYQPRALIAQEDAVLHIRCSLQTTQHKGKRGLSWQPTTSRSRLRQAYIISIPLCFGRAAGPHLLWSTYDMPWNNYNCKTLTHLADLIKHINMIVLYSPPASGNLSWVGNSARLFLENQYWVQIQKNGMLWKKPENPLYPSTTPPSAPPLLEW